MPFHDPLTGSSQEPGTWKCQVARRHAVQIPTGALRRPTQRPGSFFHNLAGGDPRTAWLRPSSRKAEKNNPPERRGFPALGALAKPKSVSLMWPSKSRSAFLLGHGEQRRSKQEAKEGEEATGCPSAAKNLWLQVAVNNMKTVKVPLRHEF